MAAEVEALSVDTSTDNHDDHLQELSEEQLEQLLVDTLRANEVLSTETQMFSKFLKRVEPKADPAAQGTAMGLSSVRRASLGSSANLSDSGGTGSRLGRKRSRSRVSIVDRSLRLTTEQKCEIAQRELEEYADEVRASHEESEKHLDALRAKLEEVDMRLADLRREEYEFERDVVKGPVNPRTGKPISEKVIKYLEDKLRAKEALNVKLRLKNTALKVQKNKLQTQLRQKEEMGEVLLEVDFSQLKIENQQFIEKIDERNQDLLKLKMTSGRSHQVLNAQKKKLNTLTLESSRIKTDIEARKELLNRIDAETKIVEEERQSAEKTNRKLRQHLADFKVPEVMEYVEVTADLYDLEKKVQTWERKVDVAAMTLEGSRKQWQRIQRKMATATGLSDRSDVTSSKMQPQVRL